MGIDYKLIGSRIKTCRKRAGLTQEKMAERLSVTVGYVSQIERGITKPNLEMLSEICRLLNCELTYLLDGVVLSRENYLTDEMLIKFNSLTDKQKMIISNIMDILIRSEEK